VYSQALIDRFGWRWAYVGVGLLPLLIALPVLAAFLPRGGGPARAVEASGEAIVLDGLEIKAALSHYRYWLLAFTALAGGVGLGGVVFNLIPLLVDRGLRPAAAAKLFGSYGLSLIFGRLASGWLLDRFWAPAVGFAFMLLPVVAALTLAQGVHATALLLMATCLMGFAGGAEFDLVAYLTSRYFGRRNFGTLYAGEYAFFGLGSGTAPALYGAVHDATGSYNSVLLATAALFASGGIALLFLGRYPKFSGLQA
jgi:predicted MFS family arabinose efflux permease